MFFKKSKIKKYLLSLKEKSTFDLLLEEWLSNILENKLKEIGLTKIEIHVDWVKGYENIGVYARRNELFVEILIYPSEFVFCYSGDEADDNDLEYPLLGTMEFYLTVKEFISKL